MTTRSPARSRNVAITPDGASDAARRLIEAEAGAVAQLVGRLGPAFDRAVSLIAACARAGGAVVVSGVGKSGLVGAKISGTLASVGIPSHCIHPTDAAHGDLGRFRPGDLCIALSYSGETEEVVALAAALHQDGIPIISISRGSVGGAKPSTLERHADAALTIGAVDEMHDLSPAPMCSTTATVVLGDALALAASITLGFTDDDFAKRHPGGTLGGLLRPVTEVLRYTVGQNVEPIPDTLTVIDALARAEATERRPGALLLIDEHTGQLTGILTDADVRRLILRAPEKLQSPISEVMTHSPTALNADALVRDAVNIVRERRCDEIPVIDHDRRPVGMIDVQDLITMRVVDRA